MFGGGKKRDIDRLEEELRGKQKELEEKQQLLGDREAELGRVQERAQVLEARCEALRSEQNEQHGQAAEARAQVMRELTEANISLSENRQALEESQNALDDARGKKSSMENQLLEAKRQLEDLAADKAVVNCFLDVTLGEFEFASAFPYFIELRCGREGEKHSTDVAEAAERPVFKRSAFLLPAESLTRAARFAADVGSDGKDEEYVLHLAAFVSVADPLALAARPVARLLGQAKLPLGEMQVAEGASVSRRVVRTVNFLRASSSGGCVDGSNAASDGKEIRVGRATVILQAKVLGASEVAASAAHAAPASWGPLLPNCLPLGRELWEARPLQRRTRVLVHKACSLPVPLAGAKATLRVALRLLRLDGRVLHESCTPDVSIAEAGSADFGHEVVLPVRQAPAGELKLQLCLEMISAEESGDGAATLSSLLDLLWHPEVVPPFAPVHLLACPSSSASPAPSFARPRPSLLVSITAEPAHEELDALGDGAGYCAEVRIHGVPARRPLPRDVEAPVVLAASVGDVTSVVLTPGTSGDDAASADHQLPIETFLYDQRMDLTTFLSSHFRGAPAKPAYFVATSTPDVAGSSRTPHWGQIVLRCLASAGALASISLRIFERGDKVAESPFGGRLLGFATLDASALLPRSSAKPCQRSSMLDFRLLEDPGASVSLEVDCRVWPRGGIGVSDGDIGVPKAIDVPPVPPSGGTIAGGGGANVGGDVAGCVEDSSKAAVTGAVAVALQKEAQEFRLSHELSVQLSKEFNLRAVALKRAGEEIVALRRQIQLLQHENQRLRAQIEDEERLAEDVQRRPVPEGLDKLGSAELAQKLQRSLQKYREEKAKGTELAQRLEAALREASQARSVKRCLAELEQAHLEQNKELQRLQEDGKKLETYRQTAKTQEKVIAKLEKILENSLAEVQKAQRVQVDVDRMKTENAKLRERCAAVVARRGRSGANGGEGGAAVEELRRQVADRDAEIVRLEGAVRDLEAAHAQRKEETPELAEERRRLREMEESRAEWEQRCGAAEQRVQMLQLQLGQSSKKYGSEISGLKVDVARRDAKILELEHLLGDVAAGAG
eukprot:TRINITY_DN13477_c0_g1_i2.p1 TRINITY_DN13477_c0_g1~~TRINITY_DN13477_c0_g1_i2.p1  ORF type:complete len:1072 (-),score=263.88 TRINITY_DN13477_c0_g1_i2:150-3365(-)